MTGKLPSGGIFLLVLGFIGLSGFLTGNLDAWLSALFSAGTSTKAGGAGLTGASATLPTVGRQTTGATA